MGAASARAECEVHCTVVQQQADSLILMERIERDSAARRAVASTRNAGLDNDRAAKLLSSVVMSRA